MSTRLPCCFRAFYDYPSWRTGGSPFVPQVPGYVKTHIIHSFLTVLNDKTVHVVLPSWIYRLFLMSLRRLNFHNAPLVRKTKWKEVFSLHGSQTERGYITMRQTTSRIVMLLTETESWKVRILIRRSYSMDFGKMLAWPSKTRLFQVPSWFGEGSK